MRLEEMAFTAEFANAEKRVSGTRKAIRTLGRATPHHASCHARHMAESSERPLRALETPLISHSRVHQRLIQSEFNLLDGTEDATQSNLTCGGQCLYCSLFRALCQWRAVPLPMAGRIMDQLQLTPMIWSQLRA